MQYTVVSGTDMRISKICLGTMTFGNPVKEEDAVHLIQYARDVHGINFVDTANMYEGYDRFAGSPGGAAEKIVGEAVKGRRKDFIIATKVGMKVGNEETDENTSPAAIRTQLYRSLKRMQTDYTDIYYLHKFDPVTPPGEIVRAIGDEIKKGAVRAWGVSNYTRSQLLHLLQAAEEENIPQPSLCQPPLSILNTDALFDLLPLCAEEKIGVVPYQVLQGGILTGKYKEGQAAPQNSRLSEKPEWMKPMDKKVFAILHDCEENAKAENISMTQYALRWALRHKAVVSALIGVKKESQIDEAVGAL